ncbi:hypothetical protein F9802_00400 [Bacillus aerolatus]|uniref:Uncharacterized protein n=1 Tax=Bacillus aerolatus TaxID=2653354 RepID=A0A6I1FUQ2_9BACI|nr:hypothetical protein F9802_00400 [Bacillus aerolatus]
MMRICFFIVRIQNKSGSASISPDKQMFFPQRSPIFDFIEERLFDLEGLGAYACRRPATLGKLSTLRLFCNFPTTKKSREASCRKHSTAVSLPTC